MPQSERGFTIIELLLVILMISIIGTLGLSIHNSIEKIQLITAAKDIQTLIRNTQEIAYGEQSTNIVTFDYVLGECVHVQNAKTIRKVVMPSKINMHKTNFDNGRLYFRGHLSPSKGGTIVLSSKLYNVRITVLPVTGRVKVYPIVRK